MLLRPGENFWYLRLNLEERGIVGAFPFMIIKLAKGLL